MCWFKCKTCFFGPTEINKDTLSEDIEVIKYNTQAIKDIKNYVVSIERILSKYVSTSASKDKRTWVNAVDIKPPTGKEILIEYSYYGHRNYFGIGFYCCKKGWQLLTSYKGVNDTSEGRMITRWMLIEDEE